MALASLAAGHELIYLLAHGPGEGYVVAMREGGHDRYWTSFVLIVMAVVACLGAVTTAQLLRLRRLAARAATGGLWVRDAATTRYLQLLGPLWLKVAVAVVVSYLLQENLETVGAGGPLPGLGVISGEHALAVPVLVAVSLVVAAVGALVGWRREIFLARLRLRFCPRPQHASEKRRPLHVDQPRRGCDGRRNGVRAPPGILPNPA
jgi:hypothetical protein